MSASSLRRFRRLKYDSRRVAQLPFIRLYSASLVGAEHKSCAQQQKTMQSRGRTICFGLGGTLLPAATGCFTAAPVSACRPTHRLMRCVPLRASAGLPGDTSAGSDQAEDVDDLDPAEVPDTDSEERLRREEVLTNGVGSVPASGNSSAIPMPGESTVVEVEFAPGKVARFETGRIARQAAGSVVVSVGETMVFCTACADNSVSPTVDFLPLRVDYAEKFSSTGRTSGSYIKREGRPSEREILVSRLIDRPLRPMFENGYFNEVQLLASVYSYDRQNAAEAMAICGSAAALHISHIPLAEPVAGVRLGYVDGEFIVEPTSLEAQNSKTELVVAGTRNGILMIEGFSDFLTEEQIVDGVRLAQESITKLCDAMDELRAKTGSKEKDVSTLRKVPEDLMARMTGLSTGIDDALAVIGKKDREAVVRKVKDRVFAVLQPSREEELADADAAAEKNTILRIAWKEVVSERMRRRILDDNIRPDGRDAYSVRPITVDQGILPRAHGSSLFTRGETQTLAVATLGGDDMAQRFETLEGENAARFYLQYSFPPSSVGEVGRIGAPGRREIGHGKLAERALAAAMPSRDEFPYVIRVESNILESNGSSSMASVCGGCLALLEAGVPMSCSVAGVAMGLVVDKTAGPDPKTGELRAVVLTDILGLEDALGSCDAKFAGNEHGLSALQLDVKLQGISIDLLSSVLKQARDGRLHILGRMKEAMPGPKDALPSSVPKVCTMKVPTKRIGDIIGPGGKTIKSIIERCGGEGAIKITIDNNGTVSFSSSDDAMITMAMGIISSMTVAMDVGTRFTGKITKILPFGAYIEVAEGKEGWLHISELENKRTNSVDDVCKVGDKMEVKVIELGRNGQFRVSRKACFAPSSVEPKNSTAKKERAQ